MFKFGGGGAPATKEEEAAEVAALTKFYQVTAGHLWARNSNWLSDKPLSAWHGVELNKQGFVLKLKLINNNIVGHLPNCLGSLRKLEKIKLFENPGLFGPIPEDLTLLENLVYFHADHKAFGLPDNWMTLDPKAQRDFIKEHAVVHVRRRNYMLLSRMSAIVTTYIRAWQTGDVSMFHKCTSEQLRLSYRNFVLGNGVKDGQDEVWDFRKTMVMDRKRQTPHTISSIDVQSDCMLHCTCQILHPYNGELLYLHELTFTFDIKCRIIENVVLCVLYNCPTEVWEGVLKMDAEAEQKIIEEKKNAFTATAPSLKPITNSVPGELNGFLFKKGRGFPYNWKRRKITLVAGELNYYDTDNLRNPLGGISSLFDYTLQVVDEKSFEFIIRKGHKSKGEDLSIKAENRADYDMWLVALRLHIVYCDKKQGN